MQNRYRIYSLQFTQFLSSVWGYLNDTQMIWCHFVTIEETFLHYYSMETKIQPKQWIATGESTPKKAYGSFDRKRYGFQILGHKMNNFRRLPWERKRNKLTVVQTCLISWVWVSCVSWVMEVSFFRKMHLYTPWMFLWPKLRSFDTNYFLTIFFRSSPVRLLIIFKIVEMSWWELISVTETHFNDTKKSVDGIKALDERLLKLI